MQFCFWSHVLRNVFGEITGDKIGYIKENVRSNGYIVLYRVRTKKIYTLCELKGKIYCIKFKYFGFETYITYLWWYFFKIYGGKICKMLGWVKYGNKKFLYGSVFRIWRSWHLIGPRGEVEGEGQEGEETKLMWKWNLKGAVRVHASAAHEKNWDTSILKI